MKKVFLFLIVIVPLMVMAAQVAAYCQDKPFPSDDEVKLVVSQTDVAMLQYKQAVGQEEQLMGKTTAEENARERKTIADWEFVSKELNSKPQAFNSVVGFDVVLMLDESERSEMLCSVAALSTGTLTAVAQDLTMANSFVNLSHTCMDSATLLFTVREGVAALYQRYVEAEKQLADEGLQVASKCADVLNKNNTASKK